MEGLIKQLSALTLRAQHLTKKMLYYQRLLSQPVANAYEREKILTEIGKTLALFTDPAPTPQLNEWLQTERCRIEEAKAEFRFDFGKKLILGLEGSNLTVRGQLPFLRIGLFSLRADFDRGSATIYWGPEIEQIKTGLKLEPLTIAKLLRSYYERLTTNGVKDPKDFLNRLFQLYRRVCRAQLYSEGERIQLSHLLTQLVLNLQPERFWVNPVKENFIEYPRIQFSYDLYLLKRSGVRVTNGYEIRLTVANFDATARKRSALWVPDNEEGEGTYYSYISFIPVSADRKAD